MGRLRSMVGSRGTSPRRKSDAGCVLFANDAAETDDGEDTPKAGTRLLDELGIAV